jgi:hypothetical protein
MNVNSLILYDTITDMYNLIEKIIDIKLCNTVDKLYEEIKTIDNITLLSLEKYLNFKNEYKINRLELKKYLNLLKIYKKYEYNNSEITKISNIIIELLNFITHSINIVIHIDDIDTFINKK